MIVVQKRFSINLIPIVGHRWPLSPPPIHDPLFMTPTAPWKHSVPVQYWFYKGQNDPWFWTRRLQQHVFCQVVKCPVQNCLLIVIWVQRRNHHVGPNPLIFTRKPQISLSTPIFSFPMQDRAVSKPPFSQSKYTTTKPLKRSNYPFPPFYSEDEIHVYKTMYISLLKNS